MVPNSMFQSGVIVSYTAVDPTMLVIVYLVITFESDVDRAREIMVDEAKRHPDFLPLGNLPVTHVMDYPGGGNRGSGMYGGVDLRLLSAARDQPTAFQVEKDLLYSIRQRFAAEGVQVAYPTQRLIVESAEGRGRSPGGRSSGPERPPDEGRDRSPPTRPAESSTSLPGEGRKRPDGRPPSPEGRTRPACPGPESGCTARRSRSSRRRSRRGSRGTSRRGIQG